MHLFTELLLRTKKWKLCVAASLVFIMQIFIESR